MSVVVLISGRGSNLQAMLDAGIPVSAVISNRADAAGLALAARRGIATAVVEHRAFDSREDFEAALGAEIDRHAPKLVALAGFMRVLTPAFVARYAGRIVNIHPSLLPEFPGLDTHARALSAGAKRHGCTVHFVTAQLDHGPIIAQRCVPVLEDDTPATLGQRVRAAEQMLYPEAIRLFAAGRLQVEDRRVRVLSER